MEEIKRLAADRRDVLRNESIFGGRHDIQRQRSAGHDRKSVLVRAVVRPSTVLVVATMLVTYRVAIFMSMMTTRVIGVPGG